MSLREVWADAWRKQYGLNEGWIVNLDLDQRLSLGAVGVVDGDTFHYETSLSERSIPVPRPDPTQSPDAEPWQFQSNEDITASVTAGGSTGGTTAPVAKAEWDVEVTFGRHEGVTIHGLGKWWNQFADMGVLRSTMVDAARKGWLHEGESVVATQQVTGNGVLFKAEGHDASLSASASVDVDPGVTPSIGSLSGRLSLKRASGGAAYESFGDGTVLAVRCLYLGKRGWLWWRDWGVYGILAVDPDEIEDQVMTAREGDGPNEYFALL